MAELRKIVPETGWLEFELADAKIIDPPVFRCRLRPATGFDGADLSEAGAKKISDMTLGLALGAITAWDLTENGAPIPCNDDARLRLKDSMRFLLAQPLKGGGYLATSIINKAQDPASFSGN